MAHRLLVLQEMAHRWYLGDGQSDPPRTPAGALETRSSAQRGRGGFPIAQEHRGRVGGEERGFDGGKKVKGRKRHILVDTEGFVLEAKVHSAKVMDYEGIKTLLRRANERFPRLRHLWLDAGYRGFYMGAASVRKVLALCVHLALPPKDAGPKTLLMTGAGQIP